MDLMTARRTLSYAASDAASLRRLSDAELDRLYDAVLLAREPKPETPAEEGQQAEYAAIESLIHTENERRSLIG